ncbi:MAG: response regulator transcription factor, partial [Clostridiaceae bacterium]|nr:response regulator transcription factor [Clostridiaceae bacterium]
MRVLIAEDEVYIAKALKVMLEKNKYTVDMVHNGVDAFDYISSLSYDVIVLDIMMPGMDGIEVVKKTRSKGISTPVLLLTAKSEVADRVAGLDAGADDYLPKPFASAEFLARVRALVRRSETFVSEVLTLSNTTLDCNQYVLSGQNGDVRLNNKEFQLMELFFRNPGKIFSSDLIMERIWTLDSEAEIGVVWTY